MPTRVPGILQTTVRAAEPTLFVLNLSVPGLKLSDALTRRPVSPLIHRNDAFQTALNLILGFPSMIIEVDDKKAPLWTQVQYSQKMFPTLALIELGFYEILEAAIKGDPGQLPDTTSFRADYTRVVSALRSQFSEVVVTTIPDPLDTAFFASVPSAGKLLHTQPSVLLDLYGLQGDDLIALPGVNEIATQILDRNVKPLPPALVLKAAPVEALRIRVRALNAEIVSLARREGAVVYDLNAFFARLKIKGFSVGARQITGDFLGGFYSLNGYYPGAVGHALIANDALDLLNRTYDSSFAPIDAAALLPDDPIANSFPAADGPEYTLEDLLPADRLGHPVGEEPAWQKPKSAPGSPAGNIKTGKNFANGELR